MDATRHVQQAHLEGIDIQVKVSIRRVLFRDPAYRNMTSIDRKVTTKSITDTTSIFQR